jgi:hypothetical protein
MRLHAHTQARGLGFGPTSVCCPKLSGTMVFEYRPRLDWEV